jgi:hypothetical protein
VIDVEDIAMMNLVVVLAIVDDLIDSSNEQYPAENIYVA